MNNSDIRPNIKENCNMGEFRMWCQKVIPLVYDDSMSYYELLCKVVEKVNSMVVSVNDIGERFNEVVAEFNELKVYVDDYFNNLDVQTEINNKLDKMAKDGTLSKLIQPLFDAYKKDIDATVNKQNNDIKILKERMDTFSSLPDGSTSGDAELVDIRVGGDGVTYKSAGEAVRGQYNKNKNDILSVNKNTGVIIPIYTKERIRSSGEIVESTHHLLTNIINPTGNSIRITYKATDKNIKFGTARWSMNGEYIPGSSSYPVYNDSVELTAGYFYRIVFWYNTEGTNISQYEEEIKNSCIFEVIDDDLSEKNKKTLYDLKGILDWSIGSFDKQGKDVPLKNILPWRLKTEQTKFPYDLMVKTEYPCRCDVYIWGEDGIVTQNVAVNDFVIKANTFFRICLIDYGNSSKALYDILEAPQYKACKIFNYDKYKDLLALIKNESVKVNDVPDYWKSHLDNKEKTINDIIFQAVKNGNEINTFFFQSDYHFLSTPDYPVTYPLLMEDISKKCGINLLVDGGDLITDAPTHKENIFEINKAVELMEKTDIRYILTQGNHDNGVGIPHGGNFKAERIVRDGEWILHTSGKMLNTMPDVVFEPKVRKAFYYDDNVAKIRFISIDSFENDTYDDNGDGTVTVHLGRPSDNQIAWIRNVALANIPQGYGVITFTHMAMIQPEVNGTPIPFGYSTDLGEKVLPIIKEFKTKGGEYIGHFCGHLHHDFLTTKDGITCVQILNAGTHHRTKDYFVGYEELVGDSPLKTVGTNTECAFDVVIVNRTLKKVDLIRIGVGENKSYIYQ